MLLIFIVFMKYNLYHQAEVVLLLYKMLYSELYKLLKMLILVSITIKDMVYVLMKDLVMQ